MIASLAAGKEISAALGGALRILQADPEGTPLMKTILRAVDEAVTDRNPEREARHLHALRGQRPRGLILAEGYRFGFPIAGAFTVGDVIVTASDFDRLGAAQPDLLDHERRHSCQYAVLGPWFLPAYGVASAWSWWRAGDPATRNAFERHAGLVSGGYLPQ